LGGTHLKFWSEVKAMAITSTETIVGVFQTPQTAQRAVMDLRSSGCGDDRIGVLSRNDDGRIVGKGKGDGAEAETATGAATGAAAGAGIGALWGLGILAGAIPGIGPAIAGGTLGVILSSAAAGAAAAGIAGALVGMGLSHDDASYLEGEYKQGRTLVTVHAGAKASSALQIIQRHGGQVRQQQAAGV
jgi:hypothetical protein